MTDEPTTRHQRAHGWNLYLLAISSAKSFAGLYQDPKDPFLTFRDLVDELRLCFHDDENWEGIAFGLDKRCRLHGFPLFVTEGELDTVIPSLPQPDPQQRVVVRYHIARHTACQLAENSPLEDHLQPSCASHIPLPTRRNEPRYLALGASSSNNQITRMSPRRTKSRKRKRSGSASPDKEPEDASEILVLVSRLLEPTQARDVVDSFRERVMVSKRCAITGKGQSWCFHPTIGPGVQACHIVLSQHFHVYPTGDDTQDTERRLVEAWYDTWSFDNGLLLRRDIHELFNARLISIHPYTHRIRAFVPYDMILDYHGRIARIHRMVDREALAHHYEMTCIENMAAEMLTPESITAAFNSFFGIGDSSPSARSDLFTTSDSYITPANSRQFLADVNFELEKLQR